MKRVFIVCLYISGILMQLQAQYNEKLWYKQPAAVWTEALPVGNGHLGAMVFGRVNEELIQLNESTLWSGGPVPHRINPDASKYLQPLREALQKEDYDSAAKLSRKMQGLYTEAYMPLGDLVIRQNFIDTTTSSYYRELDIANATTTTKFTISGISYTREIFASAQDSVIVIRIMCDKPGKLSLDIGARSLLHFNITATANDELTMKGKAPVHLDHNYYKKKGEPIVYYDTTGCNGMRYEMVVKAINRDGAVSADSLGIHVSNASDVILYIAAATSFNGFDKCPDSNGKDEHTIANAHLQFAISKPHQFLLSRHIADYKKYYDRLSFNIKDTAIINESKSLPSNERLIAYSNGAYDPGIETLYFQYGRYLLISSSRPGSTAANLQGIWNKELSPPWSSNYTININTQMNYWPAEVTNLPEMHEPLFQLIKNISVTGRETAKEFYDMKGWVAHHNSDIWAASNPVGDKGGGSPKWANWPQGGNWLCQHLWEHYAFTGDKKFLQNIAYPLMKDAALFCLDWLIEDKDGYLIMSPSTSPENVFRNAEGKESEISVATTMDMSIIWDLFTNLIEASTVLNTDVQLRNVLIEKKKKLYPLKIGKKGNLQEWNKDWEDVEVHHRHVSHLFGLHPGRQIAPVSTPEFAAAARKTLEIRGDDGTGWSKAWKINFWARLLDGDHAYVLLRQLLQATGESGTNYTKGGGTYPNFFDAHPPFQIDGNFGGTAGMSEMLLQSHLNEIHLLAALPSAWKEGNINGLKARGNFEINIAWKNHALSLAEIKSLSGGICKVRAAVPFIVEGVNAKATADKNGYVAMFNAKKGERYVVRSLEK